MTTINMEFTELQQHIWDFYEHKRHELYIGNQRSEKLPSSDAFFCALDTARNKKFFSAISHALQDLKKLWKTDISVVDAWAGIGVLWIYALIHGADFVSFIESNKSTALYLQEFLERLHISRESYEIMVTDAVTCEVVRRYDVFISETISIDFHREDFHKILENFRLSLKNSSVIIPEAFLLEKILENNTKIQKLWETRDVFNLEEFLQWKWEVTWVCRLYKNTEISSWETVSFFNNSLH